MDVGRAVQPELDHPGRGGFVGHPVDQDEPAGIAVDGVRVERDRSRGRQIAQADLVERQGARRHVRAAVDIDPMLERGHRRRRAAGTEL